MLDITLRSRYEAKAKIKEAIQFLEPDLYIVTRNGAIIKTNKLLLSLSSPLLLPRLQKTVQQRGVTSQSL